MWGLCQNVEIVHQHHHHFYELVLPNKSRNRSLLSKTQSLNDPSSPIPLHPSSFGSIQEVPSSTFYRSKRNYLGRGQKGIEVLCGKQDHSFQLSRINLQTATSNQQQKYPQRANHPIPHSQPQVPQNNHQQFANRALICQDFTPKKTEMNKADTNKISGGLDESIGKSTPTVCRNVISHHASLKASHYFHLHQLKQSTIGFKNASVCDTKKKHREVPSCNHHNVSLSTPADTNNVSKNHHHQSSEIYLRDNDSVATKKNKKENGFLSAFKTEKMFDDAKSIISLESLEQSEMNIDESIIINRTMDFFTNISAKKQLAHCSLYLARDNGLNWLVSVREFEFKHEQISMRETQLHGLVSHHAQEGRDWPVLTLYRVMMEGSGLSKTIFFIQEPFQSLLDEHVQSKKAYFKSLPSVFNYFLHELAQQTLRALLVLSEKRLFLMQSLEIGDFVMVNGMFKLHSLFKFQLMGPHQMHTREDLLAHVEKLKSTIIQTVIFT